MKRSRLQLPRALRWGIFMVAALLVGPAFAQDAADSKLSLDGELLAQNKKEKKEEKKDDGEEEGEDAEGEEGEGAEGEETAGQPSTSLQRGNRMEFDGRLIRGESAGSGAVFLFQRVPRPLPSMVDRRSSFLKETVAHTLGDEGAKKFDAAKKKKLEEQKKADEK